MSDLSGLNAGYVTFWLSDLGLVIQFNYLTSSSFSLFICKIGWMPLTSQYSMDNVCHNF